MTPTMNPRDVRWVVNPLGGLKPNEASLVIETYDVRWVVNPLGGLKLFWQAWSCPTRLVRWVVNPLGGLKLILYGDLFTIHVSSMGR